MLACGEVVVPKGFWYVVGRNDVRCAFNENGLWVAERDLPGGGIVRAWAFVVRGSGTARWVMRGGWFAHLLSAIRTEGGRLAVERGAVLLGSRRFPIDLARWESRLTVPNDVQWGKVDNIPPQKWTIKNGRVVASPKGFSAPIPVWTRWVGVWDKYLVFRGETHEVIEEAV